jgi:hypothetical protein
VGESEVSRSETFVFWVLKRCGYTNTPATIFFNIMKCCECDKIFEWDEDVHPHHTDNLLCDDCSSADWSKIWSLKSYAKHLNKKSR